MVLEGFEKVDVVKRSVSSEVEVLVAEQTYNGKTTRKIHISAAARSVAGLKAGVVIQFFRKGNQIALVTSKDDTGYKLTKSGYVCASKLLFDQDIKPAVYPAKAEQDFILFDLEAGEDKRQTKLPFTPTEEIPAAEFELDEQSEL